MSGGPAGSRWGWLAFAGLTVDMHSRRSRPARRKAGRPRPRSSSSSATSRSPATTRPTTARRHSRKGSSAARPARRRTAAFAELAVVVARARDRERDHHPLPHPARELVRILAHHLRRLRELVAQDGQQLDVAGAGFGLDAVWNDDFHHTAVVALTGRREAYYTDYGGTPQELVSAAKSKDDTAVAAKFKAVGEVCSSCHKEFRADKYSE